MKIKLKDALASNKITKSFNGYEITDRITGMIRYFENPIKALKVLNYQSNLVLEKSPAEIYWISLSDDIKRKYRQVIFNSENDKYRDVADMAYQVKLY